MATTMLKVACRASGHRLAARTICLTPQRLVQQETEEVSQVSAAVEQSGAEIAVNDGGGQGGEELVDLYPRVRGKYPPGSAEDGTGWEGLTSQEAWKWDVQRRRVETYSMNIAKKLSYLSKKPVKTWKFPTVQWGPGSLHYMCDRTKTHILDVDDIFTLVKCPDTEEASERLAPILLDALRLDHKVRRSKLEHSFVEQWKNSHSKKYASPLFENFISHMRTKTILDTIISAAQCGLLGKAKHLTKCTIDENVKVAAQWSRHGVKRHPPFKPTKQELPNNALFYGEHMVDFQLRISKPLEEFYDREDVLCRECTYPRSPYKPTALGHRSVSMQRPICPGFNLGAPNEFTYLSIVHPNERHAARAIKDFGEERGVIGGYALGTSFLSAVAMAHMQGFNTHSEITYPFCTQTLVTDGREFTFSSYQLNTLQMWRTDEGNNRQNLCLISHPHYLYDVADDGSIAEINLDTLAKLLKVFLLPLSDKKRELSPKLPYKKRGVQMRIPRKVYKEKKQIERTVY